MKWGLHKSETRTVRYGTTPIAYTLEYAQRKTLGITVYPDLSVRVRAPAGTAKHRVDALVLKRAPWILRHQQKIRNTPPRQPQLKYINGETHYYLGKPHRLKVMESKKNFVKPEPTCLRIYSRQMDSTYVQHVLEGWYRDRAKIIFTERLALCHPQVAHIGIPYPELAVRKMKSSWGTTRGTKVTLNVKLVHMPVESIDYVIFHELCHLKQLNHSKRFYALLDRILPDWKVRKERMKQFPDV